MSGIQHQDLSPIGVSQGTGSWTVTGAISFPAAVSDANPASYVALSGSQYLDTIMFDIGPATVPANAYIDHVTATFLGDATATPNALGFLFGRIGEGYDQTGLVDSNSDIVANMPGTYATYNSARHAFNPTGNPWVPAEVNPGGLLIAGIQGTPQGNQITIAEFYATVHYYMPPNVTAVTGPGLISTTNQPTLTWSDDVVIGSDPIQTRFRVRVFSAAQYTLAGFNPATSTAAYDSGDVLSLNHSFQIPVGLQNSTAYRAYVQIASTLPSPNVPMYSTWGPYTSFTVNVGGPTITVTAPTGTVSSTTRPAITWTPSGVQSHYQVKVFDSSIYGLGTFSVDTSPAIYDSTDISSSAHSHSPNQDFPNGTLRAYVKIASPLAGNPDQYGTWAYTQWTQQAATAAPPAITATADDGLGGIKLDIVGQTNQLTANQASLENGNTVGWTAGGNTTISSATGAGLIPDGSRYLQLTATSSGDVSAIATGAACLGGLSVTAQARFAQLGTSRTCKVGLRFYDVSSATIETDYGTGVTDGVATITWVQAFVSVVAPAAAVRYDVIVYVTGCASSESHAVDAIGAAPGDATTWGPGGLQWGPGGYSAVSGYLIEYSDDDVTWSTGRLTSTGFLPAYIRTASTTKILSADPTTGGATTYDYESPANQTRYYRARTASLLNGTLLVSQPSAVVFATTSPTRIWLKDPQAPELNMQVRWSTDTMQIGDVERQGVFAVSGGNRKVVVKGPLYGNEFTLELGFADDASYQQLLALRKGQRVLLLQMPFGPQWYIALGAQMSSTTILLDTSTMARTVTVAATEVDAP